ncbi:unnamed protein product [Bursaphelenchus okinawaensis]|uniref:Ground-like domain-containing protein n=1 Tax=Bursaphelenchus okinawaensis TaxID=465554 RepID=A0A811KZT9_9BILA|nr:unnamed protein product [Bursaphelenchus okinawaensis]CAG9115041.1 unnamed protein product [Bursaphelenchus okinawaensis]
MDFQKHVTIEPNAASNSSFLSDFEQSVGLSRHRHHLSAAERKKRCFGIFAGLFSGFGGGGAGNLAASASALASYASASSAASAAASSNAAQAALASQAAQSSLASQSSSASNSVGGAGAANAAASASNAVPPTIPLPNVQAPLPIPPPNVQNQGSTSPEEIEDSENPNQLTDEQQRQIIQQEARYPLKQCYTNADKFMCCNERLEKFMDEAYRILEETGGGGSKKKVADFMENFMESRLDKTFEVIVGTGDYVSKSHFSDDHYCKIKRDDKFILVYGTPVEGKEETAGYELTDNNIKEPYEPTSYSEISIEYNKSDDGYDRKTNVYDNAKNENGPNGYDNKVDSIYSTKGADDVYKNIDTTTVYGKEDSRTGYDGKSKNSDYKIKATNTGYDTIGSNKGYDTKANDNGDDTKATDKDYDTKASSNYYEPNVSPKALRYEPEDLYGNEVTKIDTSQIAILNGYHSIAENNDEVKLTVNKANPIGGSTGGQSSGTEAKNIDSGGQSGGTDAKDHTTNNEHSSTSDAKDTSTNANNKISSHDKKKSTVSEYTQSLPNLINHRNQDNSMKQSSKSKSTRQEQDKEPHGYGENSLLNKLEKMNNVIEQVISSNVTKQAIMSNIVPIMVSGEASINNIMAKVFKPAVVEHNVKGSRAMNSGSIKNLVSTKDNMAGTQGNTLVKTPNIEESNDHEVLEKSENIHGNHEFNSILSEGLKDHSHNFGSSENEKINEKRGHNNEVRDHNNEKRGHKDIDRIKMLDEKLQNSLHKDMAKRRRKYKMGLLEFLRKKIIANL